MTKKLKIACLGPAGTNGHAVVEDIKRRQVLGDVEIIFCTTNDEILRFVKDKKAYYGVVPIINNSAGIVRGVIEHWMSDDGCRDEILKKQAVVLPEVRVVDSYNLKICHNLLVRPEIISHEQLCAVASHPQALQQCEKTLEEMGISSGKLQSVSSTALASKKVAAGLGYENVGAISGRLCAEEYGLKVLRWNISDKGGNTTRFHLVARSCSFSYVEKKETMIPVLLWLKNESGTLANVTDIVRLARANMSTLQLIPLGEENSMQVAFYIEFNGSIAGNVATKAALIFLALHTEKMVVLGEIPLVVPLIST